RKAGCEFRTKSASRNAKPAMSSEGLRYTIGQRNAKNAVLQVLISALDGGDYVWLLGEAISDRFAHFLCRYLPTRASQCPIMVQSILEQPHCADNRESRRNDARGLPGSGATKRFL